PHQAVDLLNSVRLKWKGQSLGWERILLKKGRMVAYFISNPESPYFQSPLFSALLQWVQKQQGKVILKEKKTPQGLRLQLSFTNINSVSEALSVLPDLE
ncbi:MAG: hypothetical protein ACO3JH_04075, partial [Flavobacteriaceae bacterium]